MSVMPLRSAAVALLLDRGLDRGPDVLRPEVEEHEAAVELRELEQVLGQPVEPVQLLGRRVEELRARGLVVAGRALEQLHVNIFIAAIGVRSSWLTSAAKSRL